MLIELLFQDGIDLFRKGTCEWCSPCPACGGRDRFIVHEDERGGRYWCRQCDIKGDLIEYLRQFHGMTFIQAAELAGKPTESPIIGSHQKPRLIPARKVKTPPPEAWTVQAQKLIQRANRTLRGSRARLDWLKNTRGLSAESVELFNLGWLHHDMYEDRAAWGLPKALNDKGQPKKLFVPAGLVVPGPDRVRIRRQEPGNFGRYYVLPGGGDEPLVIGKSYPTDATGALIVESELDAVLLAQELQQAFLIIATGSASNGPSNELLATLRQRPFIFVALDNDSAGVQATHKRWLPLLPNAFHMPLPRSWGKDPGEAFLAGNDLNLWIKAAYEIMMRIPQDVTACG